ncbi:hypothetical protein K2173_004182 [Erythroxylum novogranatense]|uniref:Small auxin up regulated protein n=1 Tax=Erythroxylum novogranatense TaxID=1862640 RepID=A0AAV8SXI5_9ROSI|nr:hypothetical protein K2173_004182 [Erythroxylum novogranatense]
MGTIKQRGLLNWCSNNLRKMVNKYSACNCVEEEELWTPKDVPRGHLAVYVGKDCRRFIIKITILEHPLFQALLDWSEEVCGFNTASKFCIPCKESTFMNIVTCINSQQQCKLSACLSHSMRITVLGMARGRVRPQILFDLRTT